MFPGRYFGARFFAPRYWPKLGATAPPGVVVVGGLARRAAAQLWWW